MLSAMGPSSTASSNPPESTPSRPGPGPIAPLEPQRPGPRLLERWQRLSDHDQVGVCLGAMTAALGLWALIWPVPTEVIGQGVLLPSDPAGLVNARYGGQVRHLLVQTGQRVTSRQVLMELDLPVQDKELLLQRANLLQLEQQNRELEGRDRLRLQAERSTLDTTLAKLADDRRRYTTLQRTYQSKLRNLDWLSRRQVVAPLAQEVVAAEQGLTSTSVSLDDVLIKEKAALAAFQQVKLTLETEALQRRFRIAELRRQIGVTEARLAFEGRIVAPRAGSVLDLQVIEGQTVATGQRLGTIGDPDADNSRRRPLKAVAFFLPADARRLPLGLPLELVPQWNQRSRFGGLVGRVERVSTLPATPEDIATATGNPQLAEELVRQGPVMRVEIGLLRDRHTSDGYHWTISSGSSVFPVREGLTITGHAYVEWRAPITYLLPGLRSLTGGYRSPRLDERWNQPVLRQSSWP